MLIVGLNVDVLCQQRRSTGTRRTLGSINVCTFLVDKRNLVPGLSAKRSELHAGREHVRPFGRKCDHAAP